MGFKIHPQASALSMDHKDAVERYAAEEYLLGELGENEAEEFEAHMFECSVCAEQVRLGVKLLSKARRSLKGEQQIDSAVLLAQRRFCRTFPRRKLR